MLLATGAESRVGHNPEAGRSLRATLATTCAVHFVHDGIGDAIYVLLPIFAQVFGLSYAEVGILRTAYSTALAFLQMPAGILAERVGERPLLAGGTVLAGIAVALFAASRNFSMLGGLILLAGVGSAVQHPLASAIISRVHAVGARRAALGVYNFSGDVGKTVVAAAIGVGIITIGWQTSIALYGGVVIFTGLFALLAFGHLGRQAATTQAAPTTAGAGGWGFTDCKGFALLGTIHLIDSACRTGFLTFLPFLLIAKGANPASIGFGLALVFIGGAAGKLVCGLLAERAGILRTVVATELATGVAIAAVVAAPLGWAMAFLMPLGVALNGTSSVLYGTVAYFVRDDRQGRSFGLFYTLGSAAGASAPFTFGLVSDVASVPVALLLIALLAVVTVPIAWALDPHITKRHRAAKQG
jgi:MFS transporter, FSR family, fosmidomycin resistance protein